MLVVTRYQAAVYLLFPAFVVLTLVLEMRMEVLLRFLGFSLWH